MGKVSPANRSSSKQLVFQRIHDSLAGIDTPIVGVALSPTQSYPDIRIFACILVILGFVIRERNYKSFQVL